MVRFREWGVNLLLDSLEKAHTLILVVTVID